jgi:hypothetical protein
MKRRAERSAPWRADPRHNEAKSGETETKRDEARRSENETRRSRRLRFGARNPLIGKGGEIVGRVEPSVFNDLDCSAFRVR